MTVPYQSTVADALITQIPGEINFPVIRERVDAVVPVAEEYIRKATRLLLMEGKVLAEPAGCIGIAAVLQGQLSFAPEDNVCFVLSGGNIGFEQLSEVVSGAGT